MLDFGFTKTKIKKYSTISNTSTIIKFVSSSNRPETHWVSTAHQLISYVQEGVSSPYVGHGWSTVLGRASDALVSLHIFHHAVIPANTSATLISLPHTQLLTNRPNVPCHTQLVDQPKQGGLSRATKLSGQNWDTLKHRHSDSNILPIPSLTEAIDGCTTASGEVHTGYLY